MKLCLSGTLSQLQQNNLISCKEKDSAQQHGILV